MSSPNDLDLGQTIRGFVAGQRLFGRYSLLRILGRGGMGVVWLARDDDLGREVALKFLPELLVHDRSALRELKRETTRSLALTHPHIVRIYDFLSDEQAACISMEYVDGETLSNLRADKPNDVFEPTEIGDWIRELCDALDYAHHKAQIVHRDLKPANLMVNSKGDLKVADFGIARSLSDSVSMFTRSPGTSGTLVYMSPQQLDGLRSTHLDDIYSLGVTLYELVTSKPPFFSGDIARQIHQRIPPNMAERRKDLEVEGKPIPQHWEETIASCLAKDPSERPPSIKHLVTRLGLGVPALATVTPHKSVGRAKADAVPRLGRRYAWIGGVLLLLVIAGTFGYLSMRRLRQDEPKSILPEASVASVANISPIAEIPGTSATPINATTNLTRTTKASFAEHLDFNDNELPVGWSLWSFQKNGSVKNQRFEVDANGGGESWLAKPKTLSASATGIRIVYSCSVEPVSWGMTQVQLVRSDGKGFVIAFGNKEDSGDQMTLTIGDPASPQFVSSLAAEKATYKVAATFQDGQITCTVTKEGRTEPLFSETVVVQDLAVHDVQSIHLWARGGWIDDVDISPLPVEAPASPKLTQPVAASVDTQNSKERLRDFVGSYVSAVQSKSPDLAVSLFAPKVSPYFKEIDKDLAYVQQDLAQSRDNWPVRRANLLGDIKIDEKLLGKQYAIDFTMDFYGESPARGEWLKGEVDLSLLITTEAAEPKILGITDKDRLKQGTLPGTIPSSSPFPRLATGLRYKTAGKQKLTSIFVKAVGFRVLIPTEIFPDAEHLTEKAALGDIPTPGLARLLGKYDGTMIEFSSHAENFAQTYDFEVRYASFNSEDILRYKVSAGDWFVVQSRYPGSSLGTHIWRGVGSYVVGIDRGGRAYTMTVQYLEDNCPFSRETLEAMAISFGAK